MSLELPSAPTWAHGPSGEAALVPSHKVPAIVLSMSVNGLGVARALGRRGVPVIGATRDADAPGIWSRYVGEVWRYEGTDADLVGLLLARRGRFEQPPVLFPITDAAVLSIVARWEELRGGYRLGLPEPGTVRQAMSKRGFAQWAERLGLPLPRTLFVDGPDRIHAVAAEMTYPCIIKPEFQSPQAAPSAALKAARAETPEELVRCYQAFCRVEPRAVVQEWLPGGDGDVYFCLQYYDALSRPLVSFCGRKIRQWPPLTGSTASCQPVHRPELQELAERFFTGIGFRGLCSMEFKRDPRTGRLVLVEPTVGRTDWQSDIANINGVPIPYVAYCDLLGLATPRFRQSRTPVKWVRWSADRASAEYYRSRGELSLPGWLWSIRWPVRWSTWWVRDPRPYLVGLRARLRWRLAGAIRRVLPGAGRGR